MMALRISPKIESSYGLGHDWVDRPQNFKGLYGMLQLLQASHFDNCKLKTLKLDWLAFHSVIYQFRYSI